MTGDEDSQDDYDLHPGVHVRVLKLKALHEERENTMKAYQAERAQLEAKYQALVQPLYKKRAEIVMGELDEEDNLPEEGSSEAGDGFGDVVGVPQFWVTAMAQNDVLAGTMTEEDIICLESLQDIRCMDNEDGDGFTLTFQFSENPFFENSELTKKYDVPNLFLSDEPILKSVEGCEIQWKDGRCLTVSEVTQKQRGKGKNKGQVRNVTKTARKDSFFHFFATPKLPDMETMDEEEALALETEFNMDYDMAQAFRTELIPKGFVYFAGNDDDDQLDEAIDEMVWPKNQ